MLHKIAAANHRGSRTRGCGAYHGHRQCGIGSIGSFAASANNRRLTASSHLDDQSSPIAKSGEEPRTARSRVVQHHAGVANGFEAGSRCRWPSSKRNSGQCECGRRHPRSVTGELHSIAFCHFDLLNLVTQDGILDKEYRNRDAASLAMGYLAIVAGGAYSTSQVQWLVDQVVTNRTPEGRAGTARALSSIFSNLGGMTAGSMLKTVYSILSSLALDPHPVVHFYALKSLTEVVEAASLSYSPFVEQTLALSVTVYLADTHEPEGGSLGSSNMRGDLPAYQLVCRLVGAVIGVLGPDLQEESRSQKMCMLLVHEFSEEDDEGMAVEAIRAVQQLLMFAPNQVDIPSLVKLFRSHITSRRVTLRTAAIAALYQIVQRDAPLMSKLGGNRLVEDLFSLLDEDPNTDGVRQIILSWIQQTSAASPSSWINLCQRIISQSAVSSKTVNKSNTDGYQDDEGQSLDVSNTSAISTGTIARWRTQLFALQCVHEIINSVASSGRPENFDAVLARQNGIRSEALLVSKVPDLIRLAFSASTATTSEVRLQGLIVLRDVVEVGL